MVRSCVKGWGTGEGTRCLKKEAVQTTGPSFNEKSRFLFCPLSRNLCGTLMINQSS